MPLSFEFAPTFVLPNLCDITGGAFESKVNPYQQQANEIISPWFKSSPVYDNKYGEKFMKDGKFDLLSALTFPAACSERLATCLAFYLWAFAADDLSDEGDMQSRPEDFKIGVVDACIEVLCYPDAPRPTYEYAVMLQDIAKRMRKSAGEGTMERFTRAVQDWGMSQTEQAYNRCEDKLPSFDEFVIMRRQTVGGDMAKALLEYALDFHLPDAVFEHPIIVGLLETALDIMTWCNDLCSFNKEQVTGDYHNLICIVMQEEGLQFLPAINKVVEMVKERVVKYLQLKKQLPSFGEDVDAELIRYIVAQEHFVQGALVWYYHSPRYFQGMDALNKRELVITLLKQEN